MSMRHLRLIGGFVAFAALIMLVLLKAFGPGAQLSVVREERQIEAAEVLVARTDIGIGQVATQANFRWQSWPREAVSQGFVTRSGGGDPMADLAGAIARAPLLAGEPITRAKLVKAGQGGVLAAILERGMRAVSTPISDKSAAGRMILPNDRVDVILIRRLQARDRGDSFVSDTLFRNVKVLAIGQQLELKDGRKTESGATTATLELTPKQSEMLALSNSMGEISLTLRSLADLTADASASDADNPFTKERSSAIRVLRYGVATRAYGVE